MSEQPQERLLSLRAYRPMTGVDVEHLAAIKQRLINDTSTPLRLDSMFQPFSHMGATILDHREICQLQVYQGVRLEEPQVEELGEVIKSRLPGADELIPKVSTLRSRIHRYRRGTALTLGHNQLLQDYLRAERRLACLAACEFFDLAIDSLPDTVWLNNGEERVTGINFAYSGHHHRLGRNAALVQLHRLLNDGEVGLLPAKVSLQPVETVIKR